jgi:hypothetical protein
MPQKSPSVCTAFRCALFAIAIMWIAFTPPAWAQTSSDSQAATPQQPQRRQKYTKTTWTITIDASGTGPLPANYQVDRVDVDPSTACPYQNDDSDALQLRICKNDSVIWKTKQSADLWVFHHDPILDKGNKANLIFHGSGTSGVGGPVDVNADPDGTTLHEYFIFIYDGTTAYFRDPKIIIGGGQLDRLKAQISQHCQDLKKQGSPAERHTATELCEEVEALENQLQTH